MKEKPMGGGSVVPGGKSKASLSCSFGVDEKRFR